MTLMCSRALWCVLHRLMKENEEKLHESEKKEKCAHLSNGHISRGPSFRCKRDTATTVA